MKIIIIPFLLFALSVSGQTGDFQLNNIQQRRTARINANPELNGNGFKQFLIGKNYRKEWTDSISVPVLNFKTDFGGLKPGKEGGGKQTHTLHLESADGREWVLRSVKKFPEKVIAPELKGTVWEDLVEDAISASYPYAVLSVGTLAKSANATYLPNTVVYIPDDPALGELRSKYKNTLALLELRTIGEKDNKSYDSDEIIPELQKSNNKRVDQKALLRIRLLDNFIMDFDRNQTQWLWIEQKANGRSVYYPTPKDRDQAFFNADGFFPRLLSGKAQLGFLQGLRAKEKNIATFNYAQRNFDPLFLNELDEQDWNKEIDGFISSMTDAVIESAINKQPKEIEKYHGDKIATILKTKRSFFKEDMLKYYRFISRTVSIVGSNDDEVFTITGNKDGSLKVQQVDKKDNVIYSRQFDPSVTKEIKIYGLEGNDQFVVNGERSPILIRLIGGPGDDVFNNNSNSGRVFVYDVSFEKNTLTGANIKNRISSDPLNNEYRRLSNEYNESSLGIFPELSKEGGLFLGPSYKITTYGFRKEPYATKHFVYVTKAFSSSAWHLHYDADFIKVAKNTDLLFRSDAKLPTVRTHFFGYGNNTVLDKNKGDDYYKAQYTLIDASLMARSSLTSWLQIKYGPVLQYYNILPGKNNNHFIGEIEASDITNTVYDSKWFTGGELKATINTRNNDLIPTRGIFSNIYTRQLIGVSKNSSTFNQVGGDISLYTDFLSKKYIVIATSFGANHNFGSFEIPQAQYLGYKQGLRGFRYQRFAGRSRVYNNTDIRINFGDVNFYLFKGPFGIIGFHDIGRVWMSEENSDTWHRGYGGGIWLAPFNKVVLTALLTYSKEEKAFPFVTFGFQF